ncbi:TRAP transporter substrate-binding protein [Victivallis vadensis]|uniref:Tripartite ATP-independent transporter DctP family solute receptor n=1 Tax=Victivallis vadensis TaxID=172901 RepID=A0A2U1AI30_9BACT|nr:TRAP transporter substrate-binding protein [Victivallis vadensis]PVY36030.1 tripartite ATP-independent transporter DctP family solute receptor [Victivallis vadensis]PWM80796.1 MAG: TRAP transporter substrate-binding protein DctP [Lentisphaerota bacterium]HJH05205.1 TRAP transporter substrate-binding protein [Victivallis vadensis]
MKLFSEWTSRLLGGGLIAVLVLSLGYAWCVRSAQRGAGDGTRILKLGHGLPTDHPVHEAMVMMAERVKKLSGGKLEIQIYPSGMIGSEAECLKQVQNGQLDISKTSTAVLESSVPEITVLGLPYVFRDSDHFWKVLNGPIGRDLAEHLPGMRGLVYYDAGTRNFYTTKKPVRKADDLKGLKIRTQQSRSAMDMVSAFGGAPTPIPWGELYTALSQGTVDGAENNLPSFETGRHMEVCRFFTFSDHVMVPDLLVVSSATWNSLSEQQREWLEIAAAESGLFQRKLWAEAEKRARTRAEELGVEFIVVDKAEFAAKMEPVYSSYTGKTAELIRKIREVK